MTNTEQQQRQQEPPLEFVIDADGLANGWHLDTTLVAKCWQPLPLPTHAQLVALELYVDGDRAGAQGRTVCKE